MNISSSNRSRTRNNLSIEKVIRDVSGNIKGL
jgi:hypothetical protein